MNAYTSEAGARYSLAFSSINSTVLYFSAIPSRTEMLINNAIQRNQLKRQNFITACIRVCSYEVRSTRIFRERYERNRYRTSRNIDGTLGILYAQHVKCSTSLFNVFRDRRPRRAAIRLRSASRLRSVSIRQSVIRPTDPVRKAIRPFTRRSARTATHRRNSRCHRRRLPNVSDFSTRSANLPWLRSLD